MEQGIIDIRRLLTSALSQITSAREKISLEYIDSNNLHVLDQKCEHLLGHEVLDALNKEQKTKRKIEEAIQH